MSKFVAVAMTALFIFSCGDPARQPPVLSVSQDATPVAQDSVQFPSPQVEFIVGPQLQTGSALNPWPWFDSNATAAGRVLGKAFPASPPADQDHFAGFTNYYDQVLTQYINAYRARSETERQEFLGYARKAADSWWQSAAIVKGTNRNFHGDVPGPTSAAIGSISFDTGRLSPVSDASAVWSAVDWISRASAGTVSPSSMSMRSPGTTSAAEMLCRSPSRMTLACAADICRSAATASSARDC